MSPRSLVWWAAIAVGGLAGLVAYTFLYAQGASYLSNDPKACTNCHVMQSRYDAWSKGSHHAVAVCNDCHLPPTSLAHRLFVKGVNGFNHALAFTTGRFPEPIAITGFNRRVTESACRHCHRDIVHMIDALPRSDGAVSCIRCHSMVGHPQ
ncbi:MAG: cytochrome c nitrite reductase small subunit [Nitrospiria bacterium]